MDVITEFEKYLPEWAHKKHYPVPKKKDKHWQEAWLNFMQEVLVPQWDEFKDYYNNIPVLTKTEERKLKLQDKNKLQETKENESSWDKIQQFLKKD